MSINSIKIMIKAVFFDYDGVLTPDKSGGYTTCRYIHQTTGIELDRLISCYKKRNRDLNLGKVTHQEIWQDFCQCVGQQIDIGILPDAFNSTPSNDAMYELARKLRTKYKTGIITDNKKDRWDNVTRKFGLDGLFDILVLSANVGAEKDSEEPFRYATETLGVKPEGCVFIDNKKENLVAPARMGIKTIFYDNEKNDIAALIKELKGFGVDI